MHASALFVAAVLSAAAGHDVDFAGRSSELLSESFGCTACKVLTHVAETWIDSPLTVDIGEMLATAYCVNNKGALGWSCTGKWACHDLCTNAVKTFGPTAIYVGSRLLFDPTTDCVKLGVCPNDTSPGEAPEAESVTPFFPVETPASPGPGAVAPEDILRVVQVTDIHWDPSSTAGANSDCGEPLCCRSVQGVPASADKACGVYGDHAGDTPTSLLHTMYESIAALDPKPDFAFFTGDDPAHNVWNQTREYNVGVTRNMSKIVRQYLGDTPVFFALGNHNGFPVNIFNTDVAADQEWLYRPLAQAYAPWLDAEAQRTFAHAGYYSMAVPGHPHLRIIALNTPLVVHDNWFTMLGHDVDPGNMTSWMLTEMEAAAARGDTVFFLGHHPVNGAYLSEWMEGVFTPMVAKYSANVGGVFLGHTHKAMLQVMRDGTSDDAPPVATAYVGAAPTPYGDINPTYRVYDVHRSTGEILDYTDYTVDMEAQGLLHNLDPEQPKPEWRPLYSARAAYNMTSLRPAEWQRMAQRMQDDDALFQTWELNYVTNNPHRASYSAHERVNRVCDILGGTADLLTRCRAHFASKLKEMERQ